MIIKSKILNPFCTIFIAVLLFLSAFGCTWKEPLPLCNNPEACNLVRVGAGPEDFALDNRDPHKRLLISCRERRKAPYSGAIYSYDLKTGKANKMARLGDKKEIKFFRPHGIDIRYVGTQTLLYVILHDPNDSGSRFDNAIAVYRVKKDSLEFIQPLLKNKTFLWSPNDLSVLDSGEIYLTNDYRNFWDLVFKRKTSDIAHYKPDTQSWSTVLSGMKMANGILARKDKVYISSTRGDALYSCRRNKDGTLENKELVVKLKGLDNLMPFEDKLVTTGHYNDLAFLRHQKSADAKAPTAIFVIDPASKTSKPIYVDTGTQFSAASTAMIHDGELYASQIFDSFILICKFKSPIKYQE